MKESRQKHIQELIDKMDLAPLGIRLRQDPYRDELTLEVGLQIGKRASLSAEAVANMEDHLIMEWIDFTLRRTLPDICDILAQVYTKMRAREGGKQWVK